jgi:hypothetical protein
VSRAVTIKVGFTAYYGKSNWFIIPGAAPWPIRGCWSWSFGRRVPPRGSMSEA